MDYLLKWSTCLRLSAANAFQVHLLPATQNAVKKTGKLTAINMPFGVCFPSRPSKHTHTHTPTQSRGHCVLWFH